MWPLTNYVKDSGVQSLDWFALHMFSIGTELCIRWRKGKSTYILQGAYLNIFNGARKETASLKDMFFIYVCFPKLEVEHKCSGKSLISPFISFYLYLYLWAGIVFFFRLVGWFLLFYVNEWVLSHYLPDILARLSA